jgi:hypothetical protein
MSDTLYHINLGGFNIVTRPIDYMFYKESGLSPKFIKELELGKHYRFVKNGKRTLKSIDPGVIDIVYEKYWYINSGLIEEKDRILNPVF